MTTLTPDQWQRVRALFEAALDRDPRDVPSWLGREAAGDGAFRAEVLSLLQQEVDVGVSSSDVPFLTAGAKSLRLAKSCEMSCGDAPRNRVRCSGSAGDVAVHEIV